MSGGEVVHFMLSPRVVPRGPGGGLRERDPRVLVVVFLCGMPTMFRLVGCTVSLQAWLLACVMAVFLLWVCRLIDNSDAWVGMGALAALMVLIPQDLGSCLTIPDVKNLIENCTEWKEVAVHVWLAMEEDEKNDILKKRGGGTYDHLKELVK